MANRILNSFKIRSKNKILDYRLGKHLNLGEIKSFFQHNYHFEKLWNGNRHILGVLNKNGLKYFLKLSTSEGISVVTQNEYKWNNYFNQYFPTEFPCRVPVNYESGFYKQKYFYLITSYLGEKPLCDIDGNANDLIKYIPDVILISKLIQNMPVMKLDKNKQMEDYRKKFGDKVEKWFLDIPADISKKFVVKNLLNIVEKGLAELLSRPRHGDFTPWHIMKLEDLSFGLIDGEHALLESVENYDICYFIQRVFSILKNLFIAQDIYYRLLKEGSCKDKLKVTLAARAIGGFLDESLKEEPDYQYANRFKDWVISI
ncbi:MAG: hypothetical protein M1365_08415 [Actinobacteria bacterium]|nr:hypothetical protein [Actinomycetota bacterium]